MALQLTAEQEKRISAIVDAGVYPSAEEALDAAVAAVEIAAESGFEGSPEELQPLLLEGLNSGPGVEANEQYWARLRAETDEMVSGYRRRK